MKRFNLSGWAVSHPSLILFLVIALGAAGFFLTSGSAALKIHSSRSRW